MTETVTVPRLEVGTGFVEVSAHDERLTALHKRVLAGISLGQTVTQITRQVSEETGRNVSKRSVAGAKNQFLDIFDVTNMSGVVGSAIRHGVLDVDEKLDLDTLGMLSEEDFQLLQFVANGVSYDQLQELTSLPSQNFSVQHDGILETIGAWTRPHGVRRSFELGIVAVRGV